MNDEFSNTGPTGHLFGPTEPMSEFGFGRSISRSDPLGRTGAGGSALPSGQNDAQVPPVNFDSLLGGLDNLFLHGPGGQAGNGQAGWGGLSTIIQGLNQEITSIVGSSVRQWTPDGSNILGIGGQPDFSSRNSSIGSLDQNNKQHQHNWPLPHH